MGWRVGYSFGLQIHLLLIMHGNCPFYFAEGSFCHIQLVLCFLKIFRFALLKMYKEELIIFLISDVFQMDAFTFCLYHFFEYGCYNPKLS